MFPYGPNFWIETWELPTLKRKNDRTVGEKTRLILWVHKIFYPLSVTSQNNSWNPSPSKMWRHLSIDLDITNARFEKPSNNCGNPAHQTAFYITIRAGGAVV